VNAEYLLIVEDQGDNTVNGTGTRDLLGEMTLLDDLANGGITARWDSTNPPKYFTNTPSGSPSPSTIWRRLMGAGTAGTGGPQGVTTDPDIGYRITGVYVDMYISRSVLGDPASIEVMWASDTHTNNLDQSPNCDREDDSDQGVPILLATPTPTSTDTGEPDPTPFPIGGFAAGDVKAVGGEALASSDDRPSWWPAAALVLILGSAVVVGSAWRAKARWPAGVLP
jgi:hypothetical protein